VKPQYYFGEKFGYIIAFKPHDGVEWRKLIVADPQAHRYTLKDPSMPPYTQFHVKMKAFNAVGEGPYSLTATVYSALDGKRRTDP